MMNAERDDSMKLSKGMVKTIMKNVLTKVAWNIYSENDAKNSEKHGQIPPK